MKNGKNEVGVGSLIRVSGRPMMIDDVQSGNIILKDMRTKNIFVHGLENFKRILRQIGYEWAEEKGA